MSSVREIESELLQELALDRPDFAGATLDPSPNFGPRRDGKMPAFLILHYTGLATAEEAVQVLKSPDMEVSAHYLVHEDGRIVQMVSKRPVPACGQELLEGRNGHQFRFHRHRDRQSG